VQVTSLGYVTDLALLELGGSAFEDHGDYLVIRTPHNPTFWWGNFLLLAHAPAPSRTEQWLTTFASTFPGTKHFALGVDDASTTLEDLSAFTTRQCAVQAQTVMTATDVHAPRSVNADAVCRALRSDEDWRQSIDLTVRCADEGQDPASYRMYATKKAETNRRNATAGHGEWFGAFVDDTLACQMGLFTAGSGLARFQSVETDPDSRRQGLAGTLVHHVSRFGFDQLGATKLVMVADPDYFAIDLYRAVGFVPAESQLQVERRA
jgi:ribosomal protein S18 acetylase RimI-like enzyme